MDYCHFSIPVQTDKIFGYYRYLVNAKSPEHELQSNLQMIRHMYLSPEVKKRQSEVTKD